ncbi:MAG: helix-turn-helix domain-containing protein [Acetobacteraceae bacterium]
MPGALELLRPAILPEAELEMALDASRVVGRLAGRGSVRLDVVAAVDEGPHQTLVLPAEAVRLLTDMLAHLGAGNAVMVIPEHAEMTTQQAADFLNVSRPWLIKLIERQDLPHHKVGTHRRIRFADLRRYKERMNRERRHALDKLVADAQAMGEYE